MSLGDFTAFNNYLAILIFPIIILGFLSNMIAQSQASYARLSEILSIPPHRDTATVKKKLTGNIDVKNITLNFDEKKTLDNISLTIR